MSNKLYIVEGVDGSGKSVLCNSIREATKGHIIHSSFKPNWDIKKYHTELYHFATGIFEYQPVIFDRWAVSEEVYASAFRDGPKYNADDFMMNLLVGSFDKISLSEVVFIYCSNENAIENHKKNIKIRDEMFDDMTKVVEEYDKYLKTTNLKWIQYDFNKVNMDEFVKEII